MTIPKLTERAMRIRELYQELNRRERGRCWTREEFVLGFAGDVGDLAKLVLAAEGARGDVGDDPDALGHELADCLWAVLVLARLYDVDLETEFDRLVTNLDADLTAKLTAGSRE